MSTVGGGSLIIAIGIQKSPLNHTSMQRGAIGPFQIIALLFQG
jgi:hypothetical protein